ncbi:MAG: 1,6-anhydro-N-acetylmuramyl-L-alanine amidase AmpD [Gammaproteobacteria bacterium]
MPAQSRNTSLLTAGGWVRHAQRVPSPNHNARPAGTEVSLLVIHNISLPPGKFGGSWIADLFCNRLDHDAHPFFATLRGLEVSAHFLVRRDGSLVQFVSIDERAWHAGKSSFDGRENCNDFSIGIELEGTDDRPFTQRQYRRLVALSVLLLRACPGITPERVVGHSDIAPGRKTDPGPCFDWPRYRAALAARLADKPAAARCDRSPHAARPGRQNKPVRLKKTDRR